MRRRDIGASLPLVGGVLLSPLLFSGGAAFFPSRSLLHGVCCLSLVLSGGAACSLSRWCRLHPPSVEVARLPLLHSPLGAAALLTSLWVMFLSTLWMGPDPPLGWRCIHHFLILVLRK